MLALWRLFGRGSKLRLDEPKAESYAKHGGFAKFWLNGNSTLKDNLGPTTLKCSGIETWKHQTMQPSLAHTR